MARAEGRALDEGLARVVTHKNRGRNKAMDGPPKARAIPKDRKGRATLRPRPCTGPRHSNAARLRHRRQVNGVITATLKASMLTTLPLPVGGTTPKLRALIQEGECFPYDQPCHDAL